MNNFWSTLPKPFFVLAPMEDVTDTVFRRVVMKAGRPDVLYTEFTSVEGLNSQGFDKVSHRLKYDEVERPLVAQIWGITPEDYYKSAKIIVEMGFDGLDINMGCPVKKVIKLGACSALIKNPSLAKEIVLACKEGLNNQIPLSLKTRIGFNTIDMSWPQFLIDECKPQALIIHARTVKEESKVPAHWNIIKDIVDYNNEKDNKRKDRDLQFLKELKEKLKHTLHDQI
jgi:tRNA-dihydrouridine synthase